jgi:hypothetical protein
MPVVTPTGPLAPSTLTFRKGLNAISLVNRVTRRIPGYDISEYLDEVNAAYKECWDYIVQLDDSYFTDIKIVTVATAAAEFDLLYNSNGFLNGPVGNGVFQVTRIRVLQPGDTNWIPGQPRNWNDPQFLQIQQSTPQQVAQQSPYLYTFFAKGSLLFARPLPVGTQIEVVYTFIFVPLTILQNGSITSSGLVVTGTNTSFTQIVSADAQGALPGNDEDTDLGVELVLGGNQTYRIATINSDTALTTWNPVIPAVTNSNYSIATVPDIPDGHHDVIATLATRTFMSTPANDPRLPFWVAKAEKELDAMRDTVMTRQRQEPPRRRRFPQSVLRYYVTNISR